MNLFQRGSFVLHAGSRSDWKFECDALTAEDVDTIAYLFAGLLPPFGEVEGVPRGGLRLADAVRPYSTDGPLLVVDDVLTTGASMEEHRAGREALGAVVLLRGLWCPRWVTPLLTATLTA